ncbi:MAG: hypothetical protein KDE53_29905, partial [Caldilineaceae bacterium]|nr:hypothetical protein [Caldilineaceae bacterium]
AIVYEMFPTPDFPRYQGDIDTGSWEQLALELANLPPRSFWVRRRGPFVPTKQRTLDMPDPVNNPQVQMALQRLIETSGRLYGAKRQLPSTSVPVATLPTPATDNGLISSRPSQTPSVAEKAEKDRQTYEPNSIFSDIVWDQ